VRRGSPCRWIVHAFLFAAVAAAAAAQSSPPAIGPAASPNIAGLWVLNPALTQRPEEIGFSPDWTPARGAGETGATAGRERTRRGGSRSGGGAGVPPMSRESADDSTRVQQLTGEVRTPPAHLAIVRKETTVSIADDQGHSRTFHPDGRLEELTIGTVPLPTTARWDNETLVVIYDVESGRQLRYTYTPSTNPTRLLIDIRFMERGREGDEIKLTYEPPDAHDRAILSRQPASPAPPTAPAAGSPAPRALSPDAPPPGLPPGSELRGLSTIDVVVADLSAQAAACGIDQKKITTAIAGILTDAGFKTQAYGNEDADLVVNVVTSKLPDGICVSRYDASLVSHADATFPYLKGTVAAVEVQLLRDGGMAGGSPGSHAAAVVDALAKSVTRFVAQIRAANK
jgi:hypothetical protein